MNDLFVVVKHLNAMSTICVFTRFQYPYMRSTDLLKTLQLAFFLLSIIATLAINIDQISFRDHVKDVDPTVLIILLESQKKAGLRSNRIDTVDVVINLIQC